jgi:hypothetical protein
MTRNDASGGIRYRVQSSRNRSKTWFIKWKPGEWWVLSFKIIPIFNLFPLLTRRKRAYKITVPSACMWVCVVGSTYSSGELLYRFSRNSVWSVCFSRTSQIMLYNSLLSVVTTWQAGTCEVKFLKRLRRFPVVLGFSKSVCWLGPPLRSSGLSSIPGATRFSE